MSQLQDNLIAIKAQKDNFLLPGNLRTGVRCLGVTGAYGGGDGSSMNLFVQSTEPAIKKGIWLQTNKTPENIIYDEDVFVGGEWTSGSPYDNVPFADSQSCVVTIGTDIYIFGGDYNNTDKRAYKYNTLTNTYTQLANIPYSLAYGTAAAVGTDIYLINVNASDVYKVCKYDTLTGVYTLLADVPIYFGQARSIADGTDIYICQGYNNSDNNAMNRTYKYDTINNTFTRLSDIPLGSDRYTMTLNTVKIGSYLYVLGGAVINAGSVSSRNKKVLRYDIVNDTWVQISTLPFNFDKYFAASSKGNTIYMFDGTNIAYKYNVSTNTYTQTTYPTYTMDAFKSKQAIIGNKLYVMGRYTSPYYVQVYSLESKTYEQDELVVINQGKYNIAGYEIDLYDNGKDVNSAKYAFADAWYYTTQDGLITDIPTYYGDGTSWIKIKN